MNPSSVSRAHSRPDSAMSPDSKGSDLVSKLRRISTWSYRSRSSRQQPIPAQHAYTGNGTDASSSNQTSVRDESEDGAAQKMLSPHRLPSSRSSDSSPEVHAVRQSDVGGEHGSTLANRSHSAASTSTLPAPLAMLTSPSHAGTTAGVHRQGDDGPQIVPHSFVEILLHADFVSELARRHYLVMEYVRARLPLLLELAMGRVDHALAMEVVVSSPDAVEGRQSRSPRAAINVPCMPDDNTILSASTAVPVTLTTEQRVGLSQVALRILSGRTGEARGGALDAFNATCGPVWDALTANTFFSEHIQYVTELTCILETVCNEVEDIVPFAMSLLSSAQTTSNALLGSFSFAARAPDWLSRQVSAAGSASSSPHMADMVDALTAPPETPAALIDYIAARCKHVQNLLMTLEALLVAMAMVDTHSEEDEAEDMYANRGASGSDDRRSLLAAGPYPQSGLTRTGSAAAPAGHTLLHPKISLHSLQDEARAAEESDACRDGSSSGSARGCLDDGLEESCQHTSCDRLAHVTTRAIAAFTHAFLTTTTIQRQLVEYSEFHARHHGLCALTSGAATPACAGASLPREPCPAADADQSLPRRASADGVASPRSQPPSPGRRSPALDGSGRDLVLLSPALRRARAAPLVAAEATGEEVMLALILEKANSIGHYATVASGGGGVAVNGLDGSVGSTRLETHSPSPLMAAGPAGLPGSTTPPVSMAVSQGSFALPPLVPPTSAGVPPLAPAPLPCQYCARFRVVETELTERVREMLSVLCLTTICCAAHDLRVSEYAIAYMDEQGPVFAAQATMLLAHVLTPELMAVHPPESAGGKALEWTLSFVFGGCSGEDVARVRRERRLQRDRGGRHSNPFSLASSARSSPCDPPLLGHPVPHRDNAFFADDTPSKTPLATPRGVQDAGDAEDMLRGQATALRVEYVLAASFTRCHPLMTVMGVIAETNAYKCGIIISKAVMQYACTLSQTSASLLRGPLPAARWSTPFTEAMMQGLSQLALHQTDPASQRQRDQLSPPQWESSWTAAAKSTGTALDAHDHRSHPTHLSVADDDVHGGADDVLYDSDAFSTCQSADEDQANDAESAPDAAPPLGRSELPPRPPRTDRARARTAANATPFSFMPGPRVAVTGTSPQDEAETTGTRTRRRCHALHWAKCVVLSARTLSKAGTCTVAVPRNHFVYLHKLSERLVRLLRRSNRAIVATAEAFSKSGVLPTRPDTGTDTLAATSTAAGSHSAFRSSAAPSSPQDRAGIVSAVPTSVLLSALVDTLQSAQPLPSYTQETGRPGATLSGAAPSSANASSPASAGAVLNRLLVPALETISKASAHCTTPDTVPSSAGEAMDTHSVPPTMNAQSLHMDAPTGLYGAQSLASERHEQAFADSFCFGQPYLGDLLEETPAFVSVPLHEVIFASLFSVLEAVGDVLLCEKPRLNSIFANDVLTLLYEIRLCMMESAASEDLFGITSALAMTSSSAMAATSPLGGGLYTTNLGTATSFPFGTTTTRPTTSASTPSRLSGHGARSPASSPPSRVTAPPTALSRVTSQAPIVLFPEFYVVLLESGLRINDVVRRWRREVRTDANHAAAGLLPLLQRMKARIERLQMPSEAEQTATRGALRLLLGVSTQDHLLSLHGAVLHVDDLDVEGIKKEEMTPRLGLSASQDTSWAPRPRPAPTEVENKSLMDRLAASETPESPVGTTTLTQTGNAGLPLEAAAGVAALAALTGASELAVSPAVPPLPNATTALPGATAAPAPTPDRVQRPVKHAIRLVGSPADVLAMQQRGAGQFLFNLPCLRRVQVEAYEGPRLGVSPQCASSGTVSDSTTATTSSDDGRSGATPSPQPPPVTLDQDTAPLEPSRRRKNPLISAHIAFQRVGAQWQPLTHEWSVAPLAPTAVAHRRAKEDEDDPDVATAATKDASSAKATTMGTLFSRDAGRRGGDEETAAPERPPHRRHHHHHAGRRAPSEAARRDEAQSVTLLPNTLRLLESGAFGAVGGNWSFSFMRASDAAQWNVLDRNTALPCAEQACPESGRDSSGEDGDDGEVVKDCAECDAQDRLAAAVPLSEPTASPQPTQKETPSPPHGTTSQTAAQPVAAQPRKTMLAAVPSTLTTEHASALHSRSNSTGWETSRGLAAAAMPGLAVEPMHHYYDTEHRHAGPRHLRVWPHRRAHSAPAPVFGKDEDSRGAHGSGDGVQTPLPAWVPFVFPHVPLATPELVAASPSGTLTDVLAGVTSAGAVSTPTSSCSPASPTAAAARRSPGSEGWTRSATELDMRARSPVLSMASVRKRSVSEFLRVLTLDDAEVGAGLRPATAKPQPVPSPSQQTPPEVQWMNASGSSSRGGDDLST